MRFILVFALLSSKAFALSEAELIEKILHNEALFAKDKIYLDIKRIELDASLANYSNWQSELNISFANSYYNIDKDTTSTSIYEKKRRNNSQKVALSLDKYFITSPISFSADISRTFPGKDITRYKQDVFYDEYEIDEYTNAFSFAVNVPFLKPNSQAESLKTYRRNEYDLQSEQLDYIDAKEDMVLKKLEDFLEIAFLNEENKVHLGYIEELQRVEVKGYEGNIKTRINSIEKRIASNNNSIAALADDLRGSLYDDSLSFNMVSLNYAKNIYLIDNLREYLIQYNRDLLRYDIDKKLKRIDIAYYEEQVLPELDLILGIKRNQDIGNTLTTEYDNNSTQYTSALIYSMSLGGDINDEKELAVARLNLEKINFDYDAKLNDILSKALSLSSVLRSNSTLIQTYPQLLDRMKEQSLESYQKKEYQQTLDYLKDKYDTTLEYVALAYEHQLNILEYNDYLDNIVR